MKNNYNARIEKAIEGFKEENSKNAMYIAVADDLLQQVTEDLDKQIKEILEYGCVSGIENSQIYYSDTKKFFQKYFEEIFEEIENNEYEYNIKNLDFNDLSWYGYESTVAKIYEYINKHIDEYEEIN